MRVKTSLDWDPIATELRGKMHAAPAVCRKDLARMIGTIVGMVQRLGQEEVELRRNKKDTGPKHQDLVERINEAIDDFEKWLMFAYLSHG